MSLLGVLASSAESSEEYYEDLWNQKQEYLWENFKDEMEYGYWGDYAYTYPCMNFGLFVILYTSAGEQLNIEKQLDQGEDHIGSYYWGEGDGFYLYSPELKESYKTCFFDGIAGEMRFALRECVKYFGITKEELKSAYRTMQENPYAIRSILGFLTDEEFESLKQPSGAFGVTPPEFVIEAAYMENDAWAQTLICRPYAVYVEELGRIVSDDELFYVDGDSMSDEMFNEFLKYDLTTPSMEEFWAYMKVRDISNQRIEQFANARELQLKAPQTGDDTDVAIGFMVTSVSLFVGLIIVGKKKRNKLF